MFYRVIWNADLLMAADNHDAAYNSVCDELSSCYTVSSAHGMMRSLKEDAKELVRLKELAGKGLMIVHRICEEAERKDINTKILKELSDSLESIDRDIELAGHVSPCFRPLTVVFAFSREALEGDGLSALAENAKKIYEELQFRSSTLIHMIRKIILLLESRSETDEKSNPEALHETACKGCNR